MDPLPPEILAELNRINGLPVGQRVAELTILVQTVDASAPQGSIGLLWSGEFRVSANGQSHSAGAVARLIAEQNPQFALVQDTPVGRLLSSPQFEASLLLAVEGDEGELRRLLGGAGYANHSPSSFWGIASQRFVAGLSGPVATLVGNYSPGGIFGAVELQAALDNPIITSVAGIDADYLRGLNHIDDALIAVRAVSFESARHISLGYGYQYRDGAVVLDGNGAPVRGTFGSVSEVWAVENGIGEFEPVDTTRGRYTDTSTEFGARRIRGIINGGARRPDFMAALRRLRLAEKLPLVGVALTATYALSGSAEAFELYSAGDRRGAGLVLGRTYGNIVGSEVAGIGAAVIAAPLLAAGPPGWIGYGGIVVGASILGGEVGETLGEIMAADRVWIDPVNPGPRTESVQVDLRDIVPAYSGPDTVDYNLFNLPDGFRAEAGQVIEIATNRAAFVTFPIHVVDGVEHISFNDDGSVTPSLVVVVRAGNIIRIDIPIDPTSGESIPTTIVLRTDGSRDPSEVVHGVMSAIREGGGSEEELGIKDSSLSSPREAEPIIQGIMEREGILEVILSELDEEVRLWIAPTLRNHVLSLEGIARDLGGAFRLDTSDLMGAVGQVLGRHLAGDNPFAQVALSSALQSVLTSLGTYFEGRGAPTGAEPAGEGLGDSVISGLTGDFLATLEGQAIGAISSYLVGELYESLGLEGDLAEFNAAIDSRIVAQIAYNLANPVWVNAAGEAVAAGTEGARNARGWADGINTQFFAMAAASWIGTRLAHEIYEFESIGGQIGAAAGSIYGAYNASVAYAALLKAGASNVYAFVVAVVIIIIDTLLGGYIGSAISGNAKAGAAAGWDEGDQRFTVNGVWSKNGGSKDAVRAMAGYVADLLNNVISASGSRVIDAAGVQSGAYDQKNNRFIYKANAASGYAFKSKDIGQVINHGAFIALSDLVERLAGGDVYVKRALSATLMQSNGNPESNGAYSAGEFDVDALVGNIVTARDYVTYLSHPELIEELITTEPHSPFAAGWAITFARVAELGLDRRWRSDWIGGWSAFLDETADGRIDGEALVPDNVFLDLDPVTSERLFVFVGPDGNLLGVLGDTIDSGAKDALAGGAVNDVIVLVNDIWTESRTVVESVTFGPDRAFFNERTNTVFQIDPEDVYQGSPIQLADGVVLIGENTVEVTRDVAITRTGWRASDTTGLTINGEAATGGPSDQIRVAALIDGGAGNDTIRGGDLGNDLIGGEGNDTLIGGALDDWQFGGAANDRLFAGDVASVAFSDTASDATNEEARRIALGGEDAEGAYIDAGNGDYLDGGEGDDAIYGGRGSDWLNGGAGADVLRAGEGGDILDGGAGDDRGVAGEARVFGGAGSDQYVFYQGMGHDTIFDASDPAAVAGVGLYSVQARYAFLGQNPGAQNWAGDGDYEVDGSVVGGEDAISFGPGVGMEDLILRRGTGAAGANADLIVAIALRDAAGNFIFDANGDRIAGPDSLTIRDWFDDTRRVEWFRFADGQDIRIGDISSFIVGSALGDSIVGTDGNDWVVGLGGGDDIKLLDGDDFGFGGQGNDIVSGDGDEDFVSGGDDNDVVSGGAGHDAVFGDAGNDQVSGGGGNDIVAGGRGDDIVEGGVGDDLYRFWRGDGHDVVYDERAAATTEAIFENGVWLNGWQQLQDGRIVRNGVYLYDGETWNSSLGWDYTTGRLTRRLQPTETPTVDAGEQDTLEFGIGIDIEDVQLQHNADHLELAIASGPSDTSAFAAIADRITFRDWFSVPGQIEKFVFVEVGELDLSEWTLGATTGAASDGDDNLVAATGAARDWITGGLGDDVIAGGDGDDILSGNFGADRLNGGAGADVIYGGSDNDTIDGGAGADRIFGGAGFDIASYASTTGTSVGVLASLAYPVLNSRDAAGDQLVGIEGLEGSGLNDKLWGDAGDNTLAGLAGNDILKGDLGDDTYEVNAGQGDDVISDSAIEIVEIINASGELMPGYEAEWRFVGREDINFGVWYYYYQLTVTGPSGVVYQSREFMDFVYDTWQSETPPPASWPFSNGQWLSGARSGNGVQTVIERKAAGDAGYDTLEVGPGVSLSDIVASRPPNSSNARLAFAQGGSVTLLNQNVAYNGAYERAIDELILDDGLSANLAGLKVSGEAGGDGDDLFLGGAEIDVFDGGLGHDVVSGGANVDTLAGGDGDDVLEGGAAGDVLNGGADSTSNDHAARTNNQLAPYGDTIRYVGSVAAVSIDLAAGTASGGDAAGDLFSGIENVVGSVAGNDQLRGDDWHNQLNGSGGDDVLDGRGGDDVLIGGAGRDTAWGGAGEDAISGDGGDDTIHAGEGDDVIDAGDGDDAIEAGADKDAVSGGAGIDAIHGGAGDDQIGGGDGSDTLYGDAGDDILNGGADDDLIEGGTGHDTMAGDVGADTLRGGVGNDSYVISLISGADEIVDSDGVNTIAIDGASFDKVWITRSGNDLVIGLIGGSGQARVRDYYAASNQSRMFRVVTETHTLFLAHADDLIAAMTAVSDTAPSALPTAVSELLSTYWHAGAKALPLVHDQILATDEDTPLGGDVNAVDHDGEALTYAVDTGPGHGTLSLNGDGTWTFAPNANWHGLDSFVIRVTDQSNQAVRQRVDVTVASVNDAPTITTSALTVGENAATGAIVGQLNASDAEGHAVTFAQQTNAGGRFAVSASGQVSVLNGALLDYESGGSYEIWVTATDASGATRGSQAITIQLGDVNEVPTAISVATGAQIVENTSTAERVKVGDIVISDDALGAETLALSGADAGSFEIVGNELFLRAGVDLDYEAKASYSMTVTAQDPSLPGSQAVSTSFTVDLVNVNEAPSALAFVNVTTEISETTSTASALKLADLVITDDGLGVENFSLTGPDSDNFEISGGALWLRAGVPLSHATQAAYQVTVLVDDPALGSGHELSRAFVLSVLDGNQAPSGLAFTNTTTTFAENTSTAQQIKVADLSINDDGLGSIVLGLAGADAASFEIIGTELFLKAGVALNYEAKSSYHVTVTVDDPTIGSEPELAETLTIFVTNVNETISDIVPPASLAVNENADDGAAIGTFVRVDPDVGDTVTYALVNNAGGRFAIDASTGQVTVADGLLLDREAAASHVIRIRATDSAGNFREEDFTITVANQNEAPTDIVPPASLSVTENAANGTVVGAFTRTDPDVGDTATYALVNNAGGRFAINAATGQLTVADRTLLNQEAAGAHTIRVSVADGGGSWREEDFTVVVSDVNEPVNLLGATFTVTENTAVNTLLGTAAATDPDVNPAYRNFRYAEIAGGSASKFSIDPITGQIRVEGALDYEAQASHVYQVRVWDGGEIGQGNSATATFTINLTNVNEAPTAVSFNNATTSLAENTSTSVRRKLADIVVQDDALGAESLSLSGADAASFEISGTEFFLKAGVVLNFENKTSYSVTVNTNDPSVGGNPDSSQSFTLSVLNVNEAPSGQGYQFVQWVGGPSLPAHSVVGGVHSIADPENDTVTRSLHAVDGASLSDFYWSGDLIVSNVQLMAWSTVYFTIKLTDAHGKTSLVGSSVNIRREGQLEPPIALDLDDDGLEIISVSESSVYLDRDGDGVADRTGWLGAGDGFLALDRNHDGSITFDETRFATDQDGAVSDLEGLRAYDTNQNGFFDVGDVQFGEFSVWRDLNQDGVNQAGETASLASHGIDAINLTLTLTGQSVEGATDNVLYATTSFVRDDGSLGTVGDLFLYYHRIAVEGGGLPPILFDLDGGGLALTSRLASTVLFDADNDGQAQRTGWFGPGEGVLALDRNSDGLINSGAEISFAQDLFGARTDLEGLAAFDSNENGFFDGADARFGEFRIWRDVNQDGVSQAEELRTLASWDIRAVNLTPTLTGAPISGATDNVIYATTSFIRGDGTRGTVGDVLLSFDERASHGPTPSGDYTPGGLRGLTPDPNGEIKTPHGAETDPSLSGAAGEGIGEVDRTAQDDGQRRQSASGAAGADPLGWISVNELPLSAADPADWIAELAEASRRVLREHRLSGVQAPVLDGEAQAEDPADELLGVDTVPSASHLHRRLGLADRRVLHMIDAMAGFEATSASDLARSSRQRDPKVAAMLTALPDIR